VSKIKPPVFNTVYYFLLLIKKIVAEISTSLEVLPLNMKFSA